VPSAPLPRPGGTGRGGGGHHPDRLRLGYNAYGQAGADPAIAGDHVLSAVPVQGAAANVTQLAGGTGRKGGTSVLSLRSDGTVWGWGRTGRLFLTAALRAGHREPAPGGAVPAGTPGPDSR
jgi:hypothetical protein